MTCHISLFDTQLTGISFSQGRRFHFDDMPQQVRRRRSLRERLQLTFSRKRSLISISASHYAFDSAAELIFPAQLQAIKPFQHDA